MDQETLHLHYTFHHGDAVKAANKDLQMVKKAMDENNLDTVTTGRKNFPTTCRRTSAHDILDKSYQQEKAAKRRPAKAN